MNIQFGNFIEKVISEVLKISPNIELIEEYSGNKRNTFAITAASEEAIDKYITACQTENYKEDALRQNYLALISKIRGNEAKANLPANRFMHDVDVLFRRKSSNTYYYAEIKYNDDHDTGKFVDINRKLLKTFACIQRELGVETELRPILFYFTNKRMKGNIYLPEDLCIYRGKRFFDEFTSIDYSLMDEYIRNISENPYTIKSFDELYSRIVGVGWKPKL